MYLNISHWDKATLQSSPQSKRLWETMIYTEAQFIGLAAFEHSVMTTFLLFDITYACQSCLLKVFITFITMWAIL